MHPSSRERATPRRAPGAALAVMLVMSLVAVLGVILFRVPTGSSPSGGTVTSGASPAVRTAFPGNAVTTSSGNAVITPPGDRFTAPPCGEPCEFEDERLDDRDDLSDIAPGGFRQPASGAVAGLHRTRPSQTSPEAGRARGPPVRT